MRPTSVTTLVTATATNPVPVSHLADPSDVRYAVVIAGNGTREYNVQYTIQDIMNTSAGGVTWFHHASAQTATLTSVISGPLTAVRLVTVSGSGSASATLHVLQAGY